MSEDNKKLPSKINIFIYIEKFSTEIICKVYNFWLYKIFLRYSVLIASVVSNSVRPHKRQPTRLRHPWDFPGKNTGVGCHFLLQRMKVKSESEVAQSCLTPWTCSLPGYQTTPWTCSLPGSSIHGIFQAIVLESVAIAFCRTKMPHIQVFVK